MPRRPAPRRARPCSTLRGPCPRTGRTSRRAGSPPHRPDPGPLHRARRSAGRSSRSFPFVSPLPLVLFEATDVDAVASGNWAPEAAQFALRPASIHDGTATGSRREVTQVVTADQASRARVGDGDAFRELTESYRRELRLHGAGSSDPSRTPGPSHARVVRLFRQDLRPPGTQEQSRPSVGSPLCSFCCPASTARRIPGSLDTAPTVDRGPGQIPTKRHWYARPAHTPLERINQKGPTRERRPRPSPSGVNLARRRRVGPLPTVDRRRGRAASLRALREFPRRAGIRIPPAPRSARRTRRGSRPCDRPSANSSSPVPRPWLSSRRLPPHPGRLLKGPPGQQTHHWSFANAVSDGADGRAQL